MWSYGKYGINPKDGQPREGGYGGMITEQC